MDEPDEAPALLPARMINEFVYCPRLFWLEHVEREFEESYDTVDGQRVHRRVDRPRGDLPDGAEEARREATSVELSSVVLGIVAKIDMVRTEGNRAMPIDFKRGAVPARGPYDPERVQVALQAMLLREAGYQCDSARIYYAASKTHVEVAIDGPLISLASDAVRQAAEVAAKTVIPAPLVDSPKCARCSLHAICMPDEITSLRGNGAKRAIRPFSAPADDRVPLYVVDAGARVGLSGETIAIRTTDGSEQTIPLLDVASVSLFGNVQISSQAMRALLMRDLPVYYLSYGGWLNGHARSIADHSLDLRVIQHTSVRDPEVCLKLARAFVLGKVKNQRTMIRRALAKQGKSSLQSLALLMHRIARARTIEELLGLEGNAAKQYFEAFGEMLSIGTGFEVTGRNRRPPTDPVNAMLSFGYSMLAKEALSATISVGFEPGLGFYHRFRPGRPSLALDLMEEFRPLVVDSTILTLINTGEIRASHFDRRGKAIVLTDSGRRTFIGAIERRLRTTITHPIFGYQVTYRRALNAQARLLARTIQGDIPDYPPFVTR